MHDAMVCTIGHSNRPIEDFIGLIWTNEVAQVIDVRTIPRSRNKPQFNLDALPPPVADDGGDSAAATAGRVAIGSTHPRADA